MTSSPMFAMFLCWPERNPSPTPTRNNREPTPQAMPNIVRNERSLCDHNVRSTCAKMSNAILISLLLPLCNTLRNRLWFHDLDSYTQYRSPEEIAGIARMGNCQN